MKRFGNIFNRIWDINNLRLAHKNARKDKLFYREVRMVDSDPDYYLQQIQEMLIRGTYDVSPYMTSIINDTGKERELKKLPYFPDRIIQWAIMLQVEPIFKRTFCNHTCASIPKKGISAAVNLTKKYLKDEDGTKYCLKIDISKFYPNIDHDILKQLLRKRIKDDLLLELLDKIIGSHEGEGVPIGSYLSQYFANYYLAFFDHWMKEELQLKYVVRYMDDIIVLSGNKEHLHDVRRRMDAYLREELNLSLKPNYQVFPVNARGIDFIGFRFFHGFTLLRKRIKERMKAKLSRIADKQNIKRLISLNEWCSANSYAGWLKMCNGYRIYKKYIKPITWSLRMFYLASIKKVRFA